MTIDLSKLNPLPAGFGQCGKCAYRDAGTPAICFACFRQKCRAYSGDGCADCGREDLVFAACQNPMCNRKRWYDRNFTISYREGLLENRLNAYKFLDSRGWGLIFARVLLGFLNEHWFDFSTTDLIIANPTYRRVGEAFKDNNPRFVLTTAAKIDTSHWPFDTAQPAAIVKTSETTPMKQKTWKQRSEIATEELREALVVPNAARTHGKRIVVFDDIYTSGHTLDEIARCLISSGGAVQVTGISLARQVPRG